MLFDVQMVRWRYPLKRMLSIDTVIHLLSIYQLVWLTIGVRYVKITHAKQSYVYKKIKQKNSTTAIKIVPGSYITNILFLVQDIYYVSGIGPLCI